MQLTFEEYEYFGHEMFICQTCEKCINNCKIKSVCKSVNVVCKKYKKLN